MNKKLLATALACAQFTCLFGAKVTVTTSQELTDALNDAQNATETTKIVVVGTLEGNFTVPPTNHPIILKGKKGTNPTLDADNSGTVLTIDLGAEVTVKHLTITNGQNTSESAGGGVTNYGRAKFIHCTISNSTSSTQNQYATLRGGGIYNFNRMTIKDCLVTGNTADHGAGVYNQNRMNIIHSEITSNNLTDGPQYGFGGGLFNNGYLKVSKTKIDANTAPSGFAAGVYTEGKMFIKDSSIHHNTAARSGGGIENDVYLSMERCKIHDNVAVDGIGGGVYNDYGNMFIKQCEIHNNVSQEEDGGGIHNQWNLKVVDSKITDNVATLGNGGGIANSWVLSVKCSLIAGNAAPDGDGGGIYNSGRNGESIDPEVFATIKHSKIERNSATFGGGIANEEGAFMELIKSRVSENTATSGSGGGGGIYNPDPSQLFIDDSKVVENIVDDIFPPIT